MGYKNAGRLIALFIMIFVPVHFFIRIIREKLFPKNTVGYRNHVHNFTLLILLILLSIILTLFAWTVLTAKTTSLYIVTSKLHREMSKKVLTKVDPATQLQSSHTSQPIEICGNGFDDNADGFTDHEDFINCPILFEICNDGFDNDLDGKIDHIDLDCYRGYLIHTDLSLLGQLNLFEFIGNGRYKEICNNEIDDDSDSFIDCYDPDCQSIPTCY